MDDDAFPFPGSPGAPAHVVSIRVPKEQAQLLDQPDSWINNLKSGNSRLDAVNLPADILTSLTNHYRNKNLNRGAPGPLRDQSGGHQESQTSPATLHREPGSTPTRSPVATGTSAIRSSPAADAEGSRALDTNEDDGDGSQLESSPSPTPSQPPISPDRGISEPRHSHSPVSRQPSIQGRHTPAVGSSSDVEEELEVVAARGLRNTTGPISREVGRRPSSQAFTASRPPPCGQGQYMTRSGHTDQDHDDDMAMEDVASLDGQIDIVGRRRRRMIRPVFTAVSPRHTARRGDQLVPTKSSKSHMSSMLESSPQPSALSKDTPSSPGERPASVPRGDSPRTPEERLASVPRDHIPSSQGQRTISGKRQLHLDPPGSTLSHSPLPKRPRTDQGAPHQGGVPLSASYPFLGIGGTVMQRVDHLKPFERYRVAYPQYRGSFVDFIRACICLVYIQDQDLMRDLLYDDFIRVFGEGYVSHVAESAENSLPAHRWFNQIEGEVLFRGMVITRRTLPEVMQTYAAQIKEIRDNPDGVPTSRQTKFSEEGATQHRPGAWHEQLTILEQAASTPMPENGPGRAPITVSPAIRRSSTAQAQPAFLAPSPTPLRRDLTGSRPEMAQHHPFVIPATQPIELVVVTSQKSEGLESTSIPDSPITQSLGQSQRISLPYTPHSVIAESPLNLVGTLWSQPPRPPPVYGHVLTEDDSLGGPVSEGRGIKPPTPRVVSKATLIGFAETNNPCDTSPPRPASGARRTQSPSPHAPNSASTATPRTNNRSHPSPATPNRPSAKSQSAKKNVGSTESRKVETHRVAQSVGKAAQSPGPHASNDPSTPFRKSKPASASSSLATPTRPSSNPQSARKVASVETPEAEILYTHQSVEKVWRLPNARISNGSSPVSHKTNEQRDTSIVATPSRPSTKARPRKGVMDDEVQEVSPLRTPHQAVEEEAQLSSPHASNGKATVPPRSSNEDDGFRVSTPSRPSPKARPTTEGPATATKSKEVAPRRARHSIATGNPRAASGNDALKKVTGNRVQKESGRMSLGGKAGGGDLAKRKEAMRKFLLKKQAEKARASGSPAPKP